ncbi:hypothetical protein C4A54_02980 [Escherichia coli]|nr:hypothetical protein E1470_c21710 [Escherichia coli ECC-1470]EFJ80833.1 hypothetical protein HMPREF9534_03124 [Escherichia coli MS 69-1]EIL53917.1 hypothetical protein ECKD2_08464 [Escherichia coli KD2]ESD86038.1 hypothetical protein HMPREF1611_02141 [Escherichia coli 908573]RDP16034.1 hypothetical protein C4A60_02980 [Escherichia coli]BBM78759.1 hypothetical protein Eco16F5M1D1_2103 [Escherichia coli O8:H8]
MAKIHAILDNFVLYIFSVIEKSRQKEFSVFNRCLQFGIVYHDCLLSALKVRNERV